MIRTSNSLDPDLGPNCLPRLSADNTDRQRFKECSHTFFTLFINYTGQVGFENKKIIKRSTIFSICCLTFTAHITKLKVPKIWVISIQLFSRPSEAFNLNFKELFKCIVMIPNFGADRSGQAVQAQIIQGSGSTLLTIS